MYFDIQCSTNVELSVLQQNQLTLSVEGWKLVDIKLKRWMTCEPTANTSWQLILVETLNGLWTHSQYKLTVDIKLKRWMACEPTANTSWQLIFLVAIRAVVLIVITCVPTVIFLYFLLYCCLYISTLYIPILNCGQIRQYQAYISVSVFIRPYRITVFSINLSVRQFRTICIVQHNYINKQWKTYIIHFHSKRLHTITKINDNINMDGKIAQSWNARN